MSKACSICGALRFAANEVIGYAGPICTCNLIPGTIIEYNPIVTPEQKLKELKELHTLRKVAEASRAMIEALNGMRLYHFPLTGTDYFCWKDENPQETILAKHHTEPFSSCKATAFLSANEKLRKILSELDALGVKP